MKFLLFVGLLLVIWWLWKQRRGEEGARRSPVVRNPERMVECAYCGLHIPECDSVVDEGDSFCSQDHRIAARYPEKK